MEWHAVKPEDAIGQLNSNKNGLSEEKARALLTEHGRNSISIRKEISPIHIFINQFKNLLVLLLLAAAVVSLAISYMNPEEAEPFDALLIFAIVLANAVFGFLQEYKAEKSIEALNKMAAPLATVLRDGKEKEIAAEEVVPGDILIVCEGDKVAADALLIEGFALYADESMLTGESVPAHKAQGQLPEHTALAERSNIIHMNSVITRGRGTALVVRTGLKTEIGKIAKEIAEAPEKVTKFQLEIEDIGKKVSYITLAILIVIATTEFLLRTGDILFIFMAAVALGVAAIPEGLPAVVTLALSIATSRMLKQRALMRRLSTVQDLGSVDVICTDKTGTLTENVMTVTRIWLDGKGMDVTGKGLDLSGEFRQIQSNQPSRPNTQANASSASSETRISTLRLLPLLRCAVLCNDARMVEDEKGDKHFRGDPTEIAVLIPAYKAGLDVEGIRNEFRRVGEVPFSPERKLMSTANSIATQAAGQAMVGTTAGKTMAGAGKTKADGKTYSFVKGAPEVLLARCTKRLEGSNVLGMTDGDRNAILGHNRTMASQALRVLGFAYKEAPATFEEADMENDLVFVGLMGMIDPPRQGVREAVEDCRKAGIRVVMITGDNRYTAEAIGRELGFNGNAMDGEELDGLTESRIAEIVERIEIYSRTSPKHKVMLLKALQKNGHTVCMTGDGVNDAAAIKNADVGIAMGIRGTEVTRQASDIILLDDNFITIRNAIREGRGTFDNIRKFVTYLLGANISEVLVIFVATITSLGIAPKIAAQLLWINLVTDGLPALALGVDPPANGIMARPPRKKDARMLDADTFYFLIAIGISGTIALLWAYAYSMILWSATIAYTILFTGFVVMEMLTVYIARWRHGTKELTNWWLHLAVASSLILQLVIIYSPLNGLFGIEPLALGQWIMLGTSMAGYLVMLAMFLKVEKVLLGKKLKQPSEPSGS